MRTGLTWVVGGAVVLLLVIAIVDGIRGRADASGPSAPPRALRGVIVAADAACHTEAFRLPSMAVERPLHSPDCGGMVWSQDGSLFARCTDGVTTVTSGDGSFQLPDLAGCAPAWREDGALSVVLDGNIVITRRHGRPFTFFSRGQLTAALRSVGLQDAGEWRFSQVSWFGLTSFVAILQKPGRTTAAAAVFAQGGVETFVPRLSGPLEDLRASPMGNFAYARVDPQREYVMVSRGGDAITLPFVQGAAAIAWSPDEEYVAISTDTQTFFARTGATKIIATLPFGAHALDWLT
jgi:hypothetical protein